MDYSVLNFATIDQVTNFIFLVSLLTFKNKMLNFLRNVETVFILICLRCTMAQEIAAETPSKIIFDFVPNQFCVETRKEQK